MRALLLALAPLAQEGVHRLEQGDPLDLPSALRQAAAGGGPDRVLELEAGTYRLTAPLHLGAEECGSGEVLLRSPAGERVTLSGGQLLKWSVSEDGTWNAQAPTGTRQLFVDGERRPRARWPHEGWSRVEEPGEGGRSSFTFGAGDLEAWPDLAGAELVFLHDWSTTRARIARVDEAERRVHLAEPIGGYLPFFHITGFEPHPRYAVENVRAAWDAPGEWYQAGSSLYYRPLKGETPETVEAVVPHLKQLVTIEGGQRIRFEGITFAHTRSLEPVGGYAGIQAAFQDQRGEGSQEIPPRSAVEVRASSGVVFDRCRFEHLGGGGLWLADGVQDSAVQRCSFEDLGANGLMIGTPAEPTAPGDLTARITCEDSTFTRCGALYGGAVGVWIGLAHSVHVRHNLVHHLPYTGISLGWIWDPRETVSGGHVIERNHIHHVMGLLSDGGGVYTIGNHTESVVRANLIHDVPINLGKAGSNGFFIDEGSSAMVFEDNVIYGITRSPVRFHKAGANLLRRNILVTAEGVPHFRYNNCSPEVMTFEDNEELIAADWGGELPELGAGPR